MRILSGLQTSDPAPSKSKLENQDIANKPCLIPSWPYFVGEYFEGRRNHLELIIVLITDLLSSRGTEVEPKLI